MDKLPVKDLLTQIEALCVENAELKRQLADQAAEIQMLRDQLSGGVHSRRAAPFIKPNRAQRREAEGQQRKGRSQSFVYSRAGAVRHVLYRCASLQLLQRL